MTGTCEACRTKKTVLQIEDVKKTKPYTWVWEWKQITREVTLKSGQKTKINEYVKDKVVLPINQLIEMFHLQLREVIIPHVSRIRNQYGAIKKEKLNIDHETALL